MFKSFLKHGAITALYLLLGLSLGCYYTATYLGRSGWILPSYETIAGIILYYYSVVNAGTEIQAVHWIATFVVAGYLWIAVLWLVSNRFVMRVRSRSSERTCTANCTFSSVGLPVALATIPILAPIPFMIWWMGTNETGFSWSCFLAVCLRRSSVTPPPWLNYVYCSLATVALVIQSAGVRSRWNLDGKWFFRMFAVACAMLFLLSACIGLVLSFPLRFFFE